MRDPEQFFSVITLMIMLFVAGVFVGLSVAYYSMGPIRDQAVERGHAEYVIENKKAVWKWKDQ